MAACSFPGCTREVESHRYLRAEPMKAETDEASGRERLAPIDFKASLFFDLTHPLEAVAQRLEELLPPSQEVPVRLLWSPAPNVALPHQPEPWFDVDGNGRRFLSPNCQRCRRALDDELHALEVLTPSVNERRSKDGHHGVRTIVVRDKGALKAALGELVPSGVTWFIPYAGAPASPQAAADILTQLFGDDDELSERIRDKVAKLGNGG